MAGKRLALVIAASKYIDPDLRKLNSPTQDAKGLADILKDAKIGSFEDVKVLLDKSSHEIRGEIEEFFSDRSRDDLLLVYFSCHGIKDDEGKLYFAASDTYRKKIYSTAIPADFVNSMIKRSKSKRKVLLLDCCYSGAFAKGMVAKAGDKEIHTRDHFDGYGTIILTASDAMQYSFEGDELKEVGVDTNRITGYSAFTQAIVQGLKTGDADRNEDGTISPDDLYDYIFEVRRETPSQKPGKWALGVEGDIIIANSTKARAASSIAAADPAIFEALEYIEAEDYTNALSCLDKAIKTDPKNAKAYFYQGNTFAKLDKYEEAVDSYQKALAIDPNPKYVAAISRLLGMIKKYAIEKRKGDGSEAKDIHNEIQKNGDSATKEAEKGGLPSSGRLNPRSGPTSSPNMAYCVKCKVKRDMKNEKQLKMKNGRIAISGLCSVCGTKIFKIGTR
jgi:uncharacterized caspase-like protein